MSFSEMLGKAAKASVRLTGKAIEAFVRYAAGAAPAMERKLRDQEKQLDEIEKSHPDMTAQQKEKMQQARSRIRENREVLYGIPAPERKRSAVSEGEQPAVSEDGRIGGKTFQQWDSMWQCIGKLESANLTPYNHCVGLYKHVVNNKIMYIGRAVELNNGGFRKRLSDYRRSGDSARKHKSGQTIHENLDKIVTYVLVVGEDEKAVQLTKALERVFIAHYAPEWNFMLK